MDGPLGYAQWSLVNSWPWSTWAPAITAETQRAGHLGRSHPARGSRVVVGEAEFDETGARGHLCACCRHRRDGSNCMGPRLRKLQTKRRGRGDEERTSIEVARCFVLALARTDASTASSKPTAITPSREMRRGEVGGRVFPRTTLVCCT